jgi:hypothetical protein
MTVYLSSLAGAGTQFFSDAGAPLAGGKLYTYTAGTTTPQATYTTSAGTVANANPIILNSVGRLANEIWLTSAVSYKFILQDSNSVVIGTYDNLPGINDLGSLSAYLATYLAAPAAIGGTTPAAGAFTTLSATSTVSGAGFTAFAASPPSIGNTAPAAGAFTTLSATSTVSGAGFTAWAASPPAIGGTTPAGGRFTFAHTAPVVVTFSATAMAVDCALSNVFTTTFTANVTVAPALNSPKDGQTINWFITQDATGSRTVTWPASFKWAGGAAGVLTTTASAVDLLVATYRSSTGFWYAALAKAFA